MTLVGNMPVTVQLPPPPQPQPQGISAGKLFDLDLMVYR